MDGKAVDRAVREIVRPVLRDEGFDSFSARSAWRHHDQTVDLVVFRSFSSYIADAIGCTTYSFAITAGVFYQCTTDSDLLKPKDYELTFQFELGKSIRQPYFHTYADPFNDRPDVWYVLPDCSNLVECVTDGLAAVQACLNSLVDRFTVPRDAYRALLTETSTNPTFGSAGITMPGAPDSPRWREVVLAIGHFVRADPRSDMRRAPVLTGMA